MRHDHRPYYIMRLFHRFESWYTERFSRPQLDKLGEHPKFMKPWYIRFFGSNIEFGDQVHVVATSDRNVRFSVWSIGDQSGHIEIGDYCLICPGVRMDSAEHIKIGASSMIASGAYLSDADWHDLYDRTQAIGNTGAITLAENVWIGDGATICKGVSIGRNSIVGASAVVSKDVPENVIVAGNPARIVKELDTSKDTRLRADLLSEYHQLNSDLDRLSRDLLKQNTMYSWLRSIFKPKPKD